MADSVPSSEPESRAVACVGRAFLLRQRRRGTELRTLASSSGELFHAVAAVLTAAASTTCRSVNALGIAYSLPTFGPSVARVSPAMCCNHGPGLFTHAKAHAGDAFRCCRFQRNLSPCRADRHRDLADDENVLTETVSSERNRTCRSGRNAKINKPEHLHKIRSNITKKGGNGASAL